MKISEKFEKILRKIWKIFKKFSNNLENWFWINSNIYKFFRKLRDFQQKTKNMLLKMFYNSDIIF